MKKLTILMITGLLFSIPTLVEAHCGTCGVGNKKTIRSAAHSKKNDSKSTLNLSKAQQEKYDRLQSQYDKDMAALKADFDKKVIGILTKDQQSTYQKKATKDCCSTKK